MAVSAVRKWWINHQLDNPDTNDPVSEEDGEEEEERRRQLCINLNQALRTNQLLIDFDGGRPVLRLTAPLDLVNFPSVFHPRWPIECEVISDIVDHIEWDPPKPEPFYQPTGYERAPVQAEDRGKVVFCTDHATKRPYFTCSRVCGNKGPINDLSHSEFTLEFESRFESGNLQKAVQLGIYEYELTLRTDLYTRKHTQWFYFRVRNMKAGVTYRFTITNLMKRSSLYSQGMRPLLYSETAAKDRGEGWQRTGSNIRYYRNYSQNTKEINSDTEPLYSLTWTLQFPYDSDTCYLAHCYPYTYSRLQHYLRRISSNPAVTSYCKLRVLCHSLAGNPVYVMTITSHNFSRAESRSRKAVVVTARVHPGETNGSWMMEGFLDFLLGDSEDAQLLRDTFVFKVVPMLNPDGVVVGNYRCSLSGRDLNRKYKTVLRDSFPSVWHTRNMVERLMAERDVILYCDFHGHNRKNNVFMYGCNSRGDAALKLHEKVFPLMMSKNASNKFTFKSCKFRVQKSKEGTGRIAMWKLGIKNSYTMEATFGGSTLGDRRGTHFTTRDLKSLGFYFCDTLLDYCDPDPAKVSNCLTELAVLMRKKVRERLGRDFASDCNISVSDLETSTSGSNSSESDGPPVHLLNQPQIADKESNPERRRRKKPLKSHKERNRLRAERMNNNTQPKILQGNIMTMQSPEKINKHLGSHKERNKQRPERGNSKIRNTESDMPREGSVEDSLQEQSGGKFRKEWQANGLINKPVIPPATSHSGQLTKVTLWQGSAPVKDDSLQNMRASYLYCRAKLCLNHSSCTPHSEDYVHALLSPVRPVRGGAQQWRCSTQVLRLNPHLPASPHVIQSNQKQSFRPSLVSRAVHRGLQPPLPQRSPIYIQKIPNIQSHSGLTTKKSTNLHVLEKEPYFLPEDSSNEGVAETKQQNKGQEEDSSKEGLSQLRCGELDLSELSPDIPLREAGSHSSLFVPVLKGKDQRGRKLCKGTLADKMHEGVLSPMSEHCPQTDTLSRLQPEDARHSPSGRERQISTTAQTAADTRSSPSTPTQTQTQIFV